jgi:PAS domain S-box-containing protein
MIQRFKFFSSLFSHILIMAGIIVLTGWVGNIAVIKSIYPDWAAMNVDTAICFLLAGVTLWLLNNERKSRATGMIIRICSISIFLIGSLNILNYIFDFSAVINRLSANNDALINKASYLGKQSPLTAISFLLFAISLFPAPGKRFKTIVFQSLNLLIGIIGFVAVMGYMFGSKKLYQIPGYESMAFHTSVFFLILMLSALFSRPGEGMMKLITSNSTGGKLFRNTFPGFVGVLVLLAWLGLEGERNGFYDAGFGVSIFLIIIIAIFFSALYAIAAFSIQSELVKTEAEALLKKANINLEAAEELAQLGNWEFELQTKNILWSKQIFRLFDLEPADAAPELDIITERVHPDDRAAWLESYELASQGRQPENKMYRTNPAIIPLRYLFLTWQLEKDETGKLIKLFGITQNITETVLANKKITEREELFSKTFHSKVFGLAIINSERRVVDINETLTNLLGLQREDFIGKTSAEIGITSPGYIRSRDEILCELLEKGIIENEEISIVTPDGKTLILLLSIESLVLNKTMHWLISMVDITEKKKAEAALKETEQRAQIYYENSALLIWEEDFSAAKKYLQNKIDTGITDIKSYLLDNRNELEHAAGLIKVTSVNETSLKFYNARNFEELLTFLPAWFLESSWPVFADELHELMNGCTNYENEISVKTPEGEIKHLLLSLSVPPQYAKDLNKVLVSFVDITALKNAERSIKESEEKYRTTLFRITDGFISLDKNWCYTYVNKRAAEIFGKPEEEMLGKQIGSIFNENSWEDFKNSYLKTYEEAMTQQKYIYLEEYYAHSGKWYENHIYPSGEGLSIYFREITARKKADLLFKSEKKVMEMIATGKPLKRILNTVALNYEAVTEAAFCSILLLDEDGKCLLFGAGPGLPQTYNDAIDGELIGPNAGSCGTAAYLKKRVIVSDIATDPLWADYRELALAHNLKACWSTPIFGNKNNVLATFAIYYPVKKEPSVYDLELIDRYADQVKIAMERHIYEKQIKDDEEEYRTLVEHASDGIFIIDELGCFVTINNSLIKLSGYTEAEIMKMTIFDFVFKEDLEKEPFHFAELEMGKTVITERIMKAKGDKPVYVDIRAKLLADGRRLVFIRDITERKKTEQEIEKINRERDTTLNRIDDKVISVDTDWRYTFLNDAALEEHPPGREGIIGKVIWDVHPEMKGTILETRYREAMQTKISAEVESFYEPFNIWYYIKLYPSDDGLTIFYRDISETKKAEAELIKSQTQFQNLIENISGVYWVNDLNTYQTLYISPSYEAVWGRRSEDLYSNPADFIDAIHPDDKQVLMEAHQQIGTTTQTNISYRIVRPDGEIRWISAKTKVVIDSDNNKLEYGYAEDVTEKRIAETTLAESENRLKTILLNEPECVKLLDESGNVVDMNPAGLAMIEADSLVIVKGHKVLDIIKEPYRNGFAKLTKNVFKGISGKMEFEITGLKGSSRWLETNAVPLKNAEGKIISLLGVTRDITERKNAEQEKQLLTLRNQQTLDTMLDGFILADDKGNILDVNPAYCKMTGYSHEELLSKNINNIEASLNKAEVKSRIAEMIEKKSVKFETKHCRKDKALIDLEVSISIMDIAEKPLVAAFVRDITIRKKVQEQLNKNNEELRRLTDHLLTIREEERRRIGREIHDELGQQLTAIKMDVAWLDKKTAEEDRQYKNKLSNILQLLNGSNQSVRRILNELKPSILDEYGLQEAMEAQANQFTANTGIPVEFKSSAPELKLPEEIATCVFRVFQESLTNITRYAMAKKVLTSLKLLNGTLIVSVEDDGKGFDVQFTPNKKTFGILGMKERVRALNGKFELQSTIGKGTKIKITLPYQ